MVKYFITGANGQVGSQLIAQLREQNAEIYAPTRADLDITQRESVLQAVQHFRPDVIINAAAYTAVDKAQSEPEVAYAINRDGAAHLAAAAQSVNAMMLHISTDYVFDGKGNIPYRESDLAAPQSVYGASKWAGENAVRAACARHMILRTSWVFNEHGHNFVKTMLRLGREREQLGVVADQIGAPTYAGDIAAALIVMAQRALENPDVDYGVYHFSGSPTVSWHDFATEIFAQAVQQKIWEKSPKLRAISTAEYPLPAPRPRYSVLDGRKLQAAFGIAPSDWRKALTHLAHYL